jgi:Glycosyl transferase family 2
MPQAIGTTNTFRCSVLPIIADVPTAHASLPASRSRLTPSPVAIYPEHLSASGLGSGEYSGSAVQASGANARRIAIPTVSVVIPTLNEAKNLQMLLPSFPTWINEVVVVDGRSTDQTVEVAQSFNDRLNIRVVLEKQKGKGVALRAGFQAARGDIIVALDADCSMHPREMLVLVGALMAGADLAKGSRFIQGGGTADMSVLRMLGNWGLTKAVRMLFGGSFSDLCYGYFAFWRRHLDLLNPTCEGFEVETFIKLQALKARLKIAEIPSYESQRMHGNSNLRTFPDGWRVLRTIIRERLIAARNVPDGAEAPHDQHLSVLAPQVSVQELAS